MLLNINLFHKKYFNSCKIKRKLMDNEQSVKCIIPSSLHCVVSSKVYMVLYQTKSILCCTKQNLHFVIPS